MLFDCWFLAARPKIKPVTDSHALDKRKNKRLFSSIFLSLKDAFHIYHSFLTKLKLFSHLLYLLVIPLDNDLWESTVIPN